MSSQQLNFPTSIENDTFSTQSSLYDFRSPEYSTGSFNTQPPTPLASSSSSSVTPSPGQPLIESRIRPSLITDTGSLIPDRHVPSITERLMARSERRKASSNTSGLWSDHNSLQPQLPNSESFLLGSSGEMPVQESNSLVICAGSKRARIEIGNQIVKRQKLHNDVERDLKIFCEIENQEERDIMLAASMFNIQHMLMKTLKSQSKAWKPSSDLVKDINYYVKAFLCAPKLHAYNGNGFNFVIQVLRETRKDAPSNDDTAATRTFTRRVQRAFTTTRNTIKTMIIQSTKPGGKKFRNIAKLTKKIIGKHNSIPLSLSLYYRIAFMRYETLQKHDPKQFWVTLDHDLDELRQNGPAQFVEMLDEVYKEDIETYGDPATTKIKVFDATNLPSWMEKLFNLSTKVVAAAQSEDSDDGSGDEDNDDPGLEDEEDEEAGAH